MKYHIIVIIICLFAGACTSDKEVASGEQAQDDTHGFKEISTVVRSDQPACGYECGLSVEILDVDGSTFIISMGASLGGGHNGLYLSTVNGDCDNPGYPLMGLEEGEVIDRIYRYLYGRFSEERVDIWISGGEESSSAPRVVLARKLARLLACREKSVEYQRWLEARYSAEEQVSLYLAGYPAQGSDQQKQAYRRIHWLKGRSAVVHQVIES